jgi:hypothetical protein
LINVAQIQGQLPFANASQAGAIGGSPGALAGAYGSAYNAALNFNQANYGNILKGYQQTAGEQANAFRGIQRGSRGLRGVAGERGEEGVHGGVGGRAGGRAVTVGGAHDRGPAGIEGAVQRQADAGDGLALGAGPDGAGKVNALVEGEDVSRHGRLRPARR